MDALGQVAKKDEQKYLHLTVVDEKEGKVGTLHSFRKKEEDQESTFAVMASGWPVSHFILVPASVIEVAADGKHLRLPFSRQFIEAAPTLHNARVISFSDTVLARSYFLGEVPKLRPEDVVVDSINRPRESPGYDPNDTGLTR